VPLASLHADGTTFHPLEPLSAQLTQNALF
jgi:hypothetical protein